MACVTGSPSRAPDDAVEAGLKAAKTRHEAHYTVAYIAHAPLEPRAAVAEWKDGAEYTVRLAPRRPLFAGAPRLVRIGGERVTPETMKEFVQRSGLSIGDSITEEIAKRASEVARNLDEHLSVSFRRDGSGGLIIMLLNP